MLHSRRTRKKESWLGVGLTAVVCGVFLWWWFLPLPVTAEMERDPLYWVGLAREGVGSAEPTLAQRFEVIMIAEALRQRGARQEAEKIETDWLPSNWRGVPPGPVEAGAPALTASPPTSLATVQARIDEAGVAFDTLEIEQAQSMLRDAVRDAAALPADQAALARWWLAARQARNGLAADAVETRKLIDAAAPLAEFPEWLAAELFDGDIVAPVIAAIGAQPTSSPEATALARRWRALVRQRLADRDHPILAHHGPTTDASQTPDDASSATLWSAVEANRLTEARRLAGGNPSAQLAIARLLTWLAAPPH